MHIPVREYYRLLVEHLRPQLVKVIILFALVGAGVALHLITPQLLRRFIDTAISGKNANSLTGLAFTFIGVALVNQLIQMIANYLSEDIGWTATNMLRCRLARHCLKLDMAFQKAHTPGEMIERLDGDINALSNFFSRFVIDVVNSMALLVGVLVMLYTVDWRVGIALTGFAMLAIMALTKVQGIAVPYWSAVRQTSADFFSFIGEQLAGTEDTRSCGATGWVMSKFHSILRTWLPINFKSGVAGYTMWTTSIGVFALGNAAAFGLGAYLWRSGSISIGTVYLVFHYTGLLNHPIQNLRTQLQDLQKATAGINRVKALLDTDSGIVDGHGQALPHGPLSVEFDRVNFSYGDGEPVLCDVSLKLEAGKTLGILGRTGSGKTTMARLCLRFYDPESGILRIGGVDIRDLKLKDLRKRIGIVTQDVQLFKASVRDNLTFFDSSADDGTIGEVLRDLGLGRWLDGLPDGLDTELGSKGLELSAGEAQLLALGRLFLSDPGLVILDEASSRLDPATEQLVDKAVGKLLKGRTAIIIAHRLGTVAKAHEILVLEDSRVVEHGERHVLSANENSRLSRLLRTGYEEILA